MAVNKNFVVKNGIEVNTSLILANADTNRVGIGTTTAEYVLHVNGGIGATDVLVSGFTTLTQDLQVGTSGSIFYVSDSSNAVGVGTSVPAWPLDVRSSASVGTTALYVYGDAKITGDLDVTGDITYDEVVGRNLRITGLSTFVGVSTFKSDVYVDGNLNVVGDIAYDEVSGRNLDISGIATIATLGVSAATTSKDLLVTGVSTFSGIGTFASDVYVDGNFNISGLSTFEGLVYAASNVGVGTTNPTAAADANNTTILNAGIVTANYFYGDISGATGVSTSFTGSIGIQSGGTVIGTGITMVNITGGGSTAWSDTNVATIKLPPAGVSIGLAIALGS
jgi:hypothetical protein